MHCRGIAREELERAMREHHAEAEGRVRRVLLDDANVRVGTPALGEKGEQEAGGAGTDNPDTHGHRAAGDARECSRRL